MKRTLKNKSLQKLSLHSLIKQFVTNCSKERPGSIVTKTLKNGILIPIVTSKESYDDFKYISFIRFNITRQKLRAREKLSYFRK